MEKVPRNFKSPESTLTEDDFVLADEILDTLADNPLHALKLYLRAKPEVKEMLGNMDPRELLVQYNPNIEDERVIEYFDAHIKNDEIGMRRTYKQSNPETQREIDNLLK